MYLSGQTTTIPCTSDDVGVLQLRQVLVVVLVINLNGWIKKSIIPGDLELLPCFYSCPFKFQRWMFGQMQLKESRGGLTHTRN